MVHHATYPILIWYALVAAPGGHAIFFMFVNLISHVLIMCQQVKVLTFPSLKQPWSKSTTLIWLSIIQFSAIFVHGVQLMFDNSCNFPIRITYVSVAWGVLIIGLFVNHCNRKLSTTDKKKIDQTTILKKTDFDIFNWQQLEGKSDTQLIRRLMLSK